MSNSCSETTGTQEDYESLSACFRTVSAKGIKAPDGSLRHYIPGRTAVLPENRKWKLKLVIGHSQSTNRITADMVMQAINDSTLV